MEINNTNAANILPFAAHINSLGSNGINTFCGKEIDSTLDKKDVVSAKLSALNHLNDIVGFDSHNSNGYIIRLIVDKGERARLLDEINNKNRMMNDTTKSAGVSHPANTDNLGKNEVNIPVFTDRITFMEWADSMLYNHVWSEFIEYVTYHNSCAFKLAGLDVEEIEMDEELSRAYGWLAGKNFRNLPLNTLNSQFIVGGAIHTLRESMGSIDATEFIDYLDDNHGAFDWAKEDMRNFADSKGLVITDDVKAA